jgi:NAD(P)-dependent dehydrogenase (short-subunit alcohol dehydrogenase family)
MQSAEEVVRGLDLSGKVFVITGAYSGLGAATTKALLSAGAKVVVAGRNSELQQAFVKGLVAAQRKGGVAYPAERIDAGRTVDLGSLASVRDFAHHLHERHARIDCLINNAGIMNTPAGTTKDGFEVQMGTNVIGHFLLARMLAERTRRQVWLSSAGHCLVGAPPGDVHDLVNAPRIDLGPITQVDQKSYDGWRRYQQSKLGDILLAKQFPREFSHLKACAVHPGVVRTRLGRHLSIGTLLRFVGAGLFGGKPISTPEQGARTQTLCAVMPDAELVNGAYYADGAVAEEALCAKNMEDAKKLYDYCDQATRAFRQ